MNNSNKSGFTGLKVRIETPLIEESVKFYCEHLGLTVLEEWNNDGDRGAILGFNSDVNGQAFLELGYDIEPKNYAGMSIQIRVNNLVDIMNKIHGKINFSEPEVRPWGSKYLYLVDPTGLSVILYEGKL